MGPIKKPNSGKSANCNYSGNNNTPCTNNTNYCPAGGRINYPIQNDDGSILPPVLPFPSVSYARYAITSTSATSGDLLPLTLSYSGLQEYAITSGAIVTLPAGYVYQISYNVQATLSQAGYIQVDPVINNGNNVNLSAIGNVVNTTISSTTSANGSFILPAEYATTIALRLFSSSTPTDAVTGSLSIVAVGKLAPQYIC